MSIRWMSFVVAPPCSALVAGRLRRCCSRGGSRRTPAGAVRLSYPAGIYRCATAGGALVKVATDARNPSWVSYLPGNPRNPLPTPQNPKISKPAIALVGGINESYG